MFLFLAVFTFINANLQLTFFSMLNVFNPYLWQYSIWNYLGELTILVKYDNIDRLTL